MQNQNPIDSIDLDELLDEAIVQLAKARDNAENTHKCSTENVSLLESVVLKLNHIRDRRSKDSGIIH